MSNHDWLLPAVVNVMTGYGDLSGSSLVSHPQVDKLAYTCSTVTGLKISRIAMEEIFGVVISLIRFADEDEALAIANDTI